MAGDPGIVVDYAAASERNVGNNSAKIQSEAGGCGGQMKGTQATAYYTRRVTCRARRLARSEFESGEVVVTPSICLFERLFPLPSFIYLWPGNVP